MSRMLGSNGPVSSNSANRRGILGLFGIGIAAGPSFVKEAIDNPLTIPKPSASTLAALDKGNLNDFLSADDEDDEEWTAGSQLTSNNGKKFSTEYMYALRHRLDSEADLAYVKKHGIPEKELIEAGQYARKRLDLGLLPHHIKNLKSFSDSRKEKMAYDWYVDRYIKQYVYSLEYSIRQHSLEQSKKKYFHMFKKNKAAFLGNLIKRIL